MFIKFREKSQITLPHNIVKYFKLTKGELLECKVNPEGILLIPQNNKKNFLKKISFQLKQRPYFLLGFL